MRPVATIGRGVGMLASPQSRTVVIPSALYLAGGQKNPVPLMGSRFAEGWILGGCAEGGAHPTKNRFARPRQLDLIRAILARTTAFCPSFTLPSGLLIRGFGTVPGRPGHVGKKLRPPTRHAQLTMNSAREFQAPAPEPGPARAAPYPVAPAPRIMRRRRFAASRSSRAGGWRATGRRSMSAIENLPKPLLWWRGWKERRRGGGHHSSTSSTRLPDGAARHLLRLGVAQIRAGGKPPAASSALI